MRETFHKIKRPLVAALFGWMPFLLVLIMPWLINLVNAVLQEGLPESMGSTGLSVPVSIERFFMTVRSEYLLFIFWIGVGVTLISIRYMILLTRTYKRLPPMDVVRMPALTAFIPLLSDPSYQTFGDKYGFSCWPVLIVFALSAIAMVLAIVILVREIFKTPREGPLHHQ